MSRKERWNDPRFLATVYSGDSEERMSVLRTWLKNSPKGEDASSGLTSLAIIEAARELIFDLNDGVPVFHVIMYSFDVERAVIRVDHTLDILVDKDQTESEIEEDVANTLALAAAADVPVFPNRAEVAPALAKYHRSMLINGFTAPDGEGSRVRLMLTRSPKHRIDDPQYISELDVTEAYSPAEISLIQDAVSKELNRLRSTRALLDALAAAIGQLEELLQGPDRNEGDLQICLTENPILFGTEYIRVIPKHRLGSEYEMDYALQRVNGVVDLVEIEASTHKLFTQTGNPSGSLVHAEQQVIDWLGWIEKNHPYAEGNLPGLIRPVGFVVIGRSSTLDTGAVEKLRRRNQLFRGQIQVLTYDDLLSKANALLHRLEGLAVDG
jgi:hypothetical protein